MIRIDGLGWLQEANMGLDLRIVKLEAPNNYCGYDLDCIRGAEQVGSFVVLVSILVIGIFIGFPGELVM